MARAGAALKLDYLLRNSKAEKCFVVNTRANDRLNQSLFEFRMLQPIRPVHLGRILDALWLNNVIKININDFRAAWTLAQLAVASAPTQLWCLVMYVFVCIHSTNTHTQTHMSGLGR